MKINTTSMYVKFQFREFPLKLLKSYNFLILKINYFTCHAANGLSIWFIFNSIGFGPN